MATLRAVIDQTYIDNLLEHIDLPDYIGEQMVLVARAGVHDGLCPFHSEKSPSFKVYADHYHCFGCGAHGNAIQFAMAHRGLSFQEAVTTLASHAGLPAPENKPSTPTNQVGDPMVDTLSKACALYQTLLLGESGQSALAELTGRGVDEDTIMRFGIGFAPEAWGTLTDDKRFKRTHLLSTGLAVERRGKKGCYDFFRNRLMFPVRDVRGQVIGFGGRRIGADGPKYLNSPETPLYAKGNVLFGLPQARAAIRQQQSVIVCEGFFDVVIPAQHGLEHIVSTCGTALTEGQIELLLSLADKIVLCFDGDAAGSKATWRAAELLTGMVSDHHEVRLCRLPEGHDPDSLVRAQGVDAFRQCIDASPTLTTYLVSTITRGARVPEARARALTMVAELWRRFTAPALATFFRQYACEALQLTSEQFDALSGPAQVLSPPHLRPCPCCGHAPVIESVQDKHQVRCTICALTTAPSPITDTCISAWNRRTRAVHRPVLS